MNSSASFSISQQTQGRLAYLVAEARGIHLGGDQLSPSVLFGARSRVGKLIEQAEDSLWDLLDRLHRHRVPSDLSSIDNVAGDRRQQGGFVSIQSLVPPASRPRHEARAELRDLCSRLRKNLAHQRRRLHRLPDVCPPVTVLSVIEEIVETLAQGLCTVERRFAELAAIPSCTRHVDLVREGLRGRRASAKFQRSIFELDQQELSTQAKLLSAVTALTQLMGREAFRAHRATDRFTARNLHRDILLWARKAPDVYTARRLWTSVVVFAKLLSKINQRQVLKEHDREAVNYLIGLLSSAPTHQGCPVGAHRRMRAIRGRDADLDALVRENASVGEILAQLHNLHQDLGYFIAAAS